MNQDNTTSKKGYDGRPIWQWVLIYLIVGGAIYAAVYYFMDHKGARGYGQPTKASVQTAAPAQSQMQAAPAATPMQQPAATPMQQSGGGYNW